jgi:hypothetical protein
MFGVQLLLVMVLLAISSPQSVGAQNTSPLTRLPASQLTVYLMTMGPGKAVWERFGHNAIWIHDPARGTDKT